MEQESSEVDLRSMAVLFLVLSGVLCESEQSQGSCGLNLRCHQADGCCMGCDGALCPLRDIPTRSWVGWHSISNGGVVSKVRDRARNALGSWFAKYSLGLNASGAVAIFLPRSIPGQAAGISLFPFSFHLLLALTLFTALTLMVPPSVYVLQTLPLKHLVIT